MSPSLAIPELQAIERELEYRARPIQIYVNTDPAERDPMQVAALMFELTRMMTELQSIRERVTYAVYVRWQLPLVQLHDELTIIRRDIHLQGPDAAERLPERLERRYVQTDWGRRQLDLDMDRFCLLVLAGYSNPEIAKRMNCVTRTVERCLETLQISKRNYSNISREDLVDVCMQVTSMSAKLTSYPGIDHRKRRIHSLYRRDWPMVPPPHRTSD
jgi:hypothetical protein